MTTLKQCVIVIILYNNILKGFIPLISQGNKLSMLLYLFIVTYIHYVIKTARNIPLFYFLMLVRDCKEG